VLDALPDARAPLPAELAAAAFDAIMEGRVADAEIARFLVELAERGETVAEVVAAAGALRRRMLAVAAPPGAIDVCGTGGDGSGSLNVSTAVAIVVAATGVPVAKHGNRAASSRAGAADTLEALGVRLDRTPAEAEAMLEALGIAFLFAPAHHPAMARVGPVRRALGRRTIFNLLGPLANPAQVGRQLMGVFAARWVVPMAQALAQMDGAGSMVVHGTDGLDELSVSAPSLVARAGDPAGAAPAEVTPEAAGLARWPAAALKGGDAAHNAEALRRLLAGAPGAYRDIVLLNAAGALIVAGRAADWAEGARQAAATIDSGAAADLLARWVAWP
jgi:anthranilate phosphoribosyltransferase